VQIVSTQRHGIKLNKKKLISYQNLQDDETRGMVVGNGLISRIGLTI
jgi:hypothetical protein